MDKLVGKANMVWKLFATAASAFMVINIAVIIVNIVMRRFFNMPLFGSTEIVRYVSLTVASLALCQNEWVEGNVRMGLLLEVMKRKAHDILAFVINLVCSAAFVFISYLLVVQMIGKLAKDDVSYELHFPIWIPALVLAGGFLLLTAALILKTLICWHTVKTGHEHDLRGMVIVNSDDSVVEG